MSTYQLDSVCDFINGGAWSDTEYAISGIHVVKVSNLSDGRIIRKDDNYLPFSKYEEYKQHELRSGDIVVSTVGSHPTQQGSVVGRVALVSSEYVGSFLNQNAACIRVNKPDLVSQRYLFYLANTVVFKHHIESRARGSANQVRMAIGELKKFKAQYPRITEQKKIAAILSAYDDLIENNKRRIVLLERIAEEIYREWFVRFRFPGHEVVRFEKGMPEGWGKTSLSNLGNFLNGYAFKPNDLQVVGIPIIKIREMTSGVSPETPRNKGETINKKFHFGDGEILFSWSATLLVKIWDQGPGLLNQHLFKVTPQRGVPKSFLYFSIKSNIEMFESLTTGSTMKHIKRKELDFVKVLIPPQKLLKEFDSKVLDILNQKLILTKSNRILSKNRDILLGRLISGKLSIENLDIQFPPSMLTEGEAEAQEAAYA